MSSDFAKLIPADEDQRMEALKEYQVLFQPGQPLFNDFVTILAKLFAVPIALVSLVGAEEVVFAGNAGLPEAGRTPRTDSLCSVAVLHDGLTQFNDLLQNPCELVNVEAVRELRLGFYAGRPLRTPAGYAVGTLCVIDRQPRTLSGTEQTLLDQMGAVATILLRLEAIFTNNPALSRTLWARVRERVQYSLSRLDTLAELSKHEENPDTEAARAYRRSRQEEALLIAQAMQKELQQTLTDLGR